MADRLLGRLLVATLASGAMFASSPSTALADESSPSRPAAVSRSVAAVGTPSLRSRIDSALLGSTARGISVAVEVDGLGVVERRNSAVSAPPASTEKLYTIFAALQRLGPSYSQVTSLVTSAPIVAGDVLGDVYLVASGDPFFTSGHLDAMAASLAAAGISRIDGRVIVDDSRYDRARRGAGWKTTWVPRESGPLSAMALDGNQWRHDSKYLADPATPVAGRLRADLIAHGVTVVGTTTGLGRAPVGARVLGLHRSAPLSVQVSRIAKHSDNFAAELLLKEVGYVVRGRGSSAAGATAVHDTLAAFRVDTGVTADGSGLSTYDRKSVGSEVALLRAAERTAFYDVYRAALPIACVDGTLQHRLCASATRQRTSAKTGTLDTSRALTGWTTTADGHRVRFAFVLTSFTDGLKARAAIDRAVLVLASASVR